MNNKNEKELYIILDEALERVLKGESLELVLADYPRVANELEPLLRTALGTRNAAAITPRPEFRTRAALDFQKAIQGMPVKAGQNRVNTNSNNMPRAAHRGLFGWGTAWSVGVAVILVVLLSGTGVVTAANYAMPDSPLYNVKLAAENVQLALTPSNVGKAELISHFNDRRVNEVVAMADKGLVAEIGVLNTNMASNMVKISELASGGNVGTLNDTSRGTASYSTAGASPEQTENTIKTPRFTPAPATIPPVTTPPPTTTTVSNPKVTTVVPTTPQPPKTALVTDSPQKTAETRAIVTQTENSDEEHNNQKNATEDKWQKLREHLSEKQIKNLRSLLEAYVHAPEGLKPALKQAISIIIDGYGDSPDNSNTIETLLESYGLTLNDLHR